jgi:hypothetical protein
MDCHILDLSDPLWMQTLQAVPHDIYHLPGYLFVESQRTNAISEAILITDRECLFFVPYLLRNCDTLLPNELFTEYFDVVSPYGYPGFLLNESGWSTPGFADTALTLLKRVLREKGICSAFFRLHPILNQGIDSILQPETVTFNGETVSIDLTLSDAQLWNQTRSDHRNKINRCRREGMTARVVSCDEDSLQVLTDIYIETMSRVGAADGYLEFNYDYFLQLNSAIANTLYICLVESDRQIVSAGLYSECCGIVQAVFGGTKTEFLRYSPTTLETEQVKQWAKARGDRVLHLGGGLGGSKDRLYDFKAGFSKQRHSFLTARLIIDAERYADLTTRRAKTLNVSPDELLQSHFFPAYRAAGVA